MDADMLDVLSRIATAAGAAIMEVYETDFAVEIKSDNSPVTEADLRADTLIRAGLERDFPGMPIMSEESAQAGAACADTFFLVDPLDGTREFVHRRLEFTVNIALIDRGSAVAGVVYAPAGHELYYAGAGMGAWRRAGGAGGAERLRVAAYDGERGLRIVGSRSHGGETMQAWIASLRCAHSVTTAGSSVKFCRIAEGGADIYPRFGPTSQWDTAAGQCIVEQAGGAVLDLHGEALSYRLDGPVLNPFFVAVGDRRALAFLGAFGST